MAMTTFAGTSRLLEEGHEVSEVIRRVATPGGITEEGVKVLRSELPPVFDHLFAQTLAKHAVVRRCIGETKPVGEKKREIT